MTRTIAAIFDSGVFRPLKPVGLANGTQVELQLHLVTPSDSGAASEITRKAWQEYLERMELLPDNPPSDGLSNRDHDRIIYGG
jgi:predicted DNA-binding antitoxin AbrB/MazE fold protein